MRPDRPVSKEPSTSFLREAVLTEDMLLAVGTLPAKGAQLLFDRFRKSRKQKRAMGSSVITECAITLRIPLAHPNRLPEGQSSLTQPPLCATERNKR